MDDIGARLRTAGAHYEAGRRAEALAIYREVAASYRDQGRPHQAIAVCRGVLALAPDDEACRALLTRLLDEAPDTHDDLDHTPLPIPLPYHLLDPSELDEPKS